MEKWLFSVLSMIIENNFKTFAWLWKTTQKILIEYAHVIFGIANMKIFSWYNVIQQIKKPQNAKLNNVMGSGRVTIQGTKLCSGLDIKKILCLLIWRTEFLSRPPITHLR